MREAFARAWVELFGMEVSIGVEYRDDKEVEELSRELEAIGKRALLWFIKDHAGLVREVEETIKMRWPDRAYFLETTLEGKGTQVYDPRDFVKERCTCACTNR